MRIIILIFALFLGLSSVAQENTISTIEINGLKRTKEAFIRRLIKVKPGSTLDSLKIQTDIDRLNRLPGIAKSEYKLEENTNGKYTLTYDLIENITIIPGARIATDNNGEFAYRLSVFDFNVFGKNQLLGGFYQNDEFESFGFFWEAPFLFTNKFGLGLNYQTNVNQEPVFFPNQELNYRFTSNAGEVFLSYEYDFHNRIELSTTISREEYSFLPELSDGVPPDDKALELDANRVTFKSEYENNHINIDYQYLSGYRSLLDLRFVTGDESEDFLDSFFIGRNDFEYFKRIGEHGNWANRLRVAYASNNDNPFAPFTLDNQLNIRGVGNTVDRGTAAIVLNTEYRHTLFERKWFVIQSNVFIDAGTWRNPGEDFSQLFDGTSTSFYPGAGIRFIHKLIFNAVIRFDYGYGIGDNATRGIVFGIGQYF